jgi:branched-chain amino acid transport system substrate-binding protein
VAQCSPAETDAGLTDYADGGLYFRTAPPEGLQGTALISLLHADGHHRVAVVAQNDEYGKRLARLVGEAVKDGHEQQLVADVAYDPGAGSFEAEVAKVVDARPDAVVLVAGAPDSGGPMLNALLGGQAGPKRAAVYVNDRLRAPTLYQSVDPRRPAVTGGIKAVAPAPAPEGGAPFFPDAFTEFAPGTTPTFAAHAYDCAVVIALAAEAAGSDDPTTFVNEMIEVTRGGKQCSTFKACKKLLDDGEDIDYQGAAGPLDFIEAGEPSVGSFEVSEFQADGSLKALGQIQVGREGGARKE